MGDVVVGRIRVDPLSAITRVPLDADDLRDMAYSRARAAAAASAAARARSLPRRRSSPRSSCSPGANNEGTNVDPSGASATGNGDVLSVAGSAVATATATAKADSSSSDGINTNGGSGGEYGIAAFCLDSSCEVGRVALVFGGAPIVGCSSDDVHDNSSNSGLRGRDLGSSNSKHRERTGGGKRASATQELSNPEVWLQDLSCR